MVKAKLHKYLTYPSSLQQQLQERQTELYMKKAKLDKKGWENPVCNSKI